MACSWSDHWRRSGVYFHLPGLGLCVGLLLGGALGLVREDKRRGVHRAADPLWFVIGLLIGLTGGLSLHFIGLTWPFSLFIGLALGAVFGAVAGTIVETDAVRRSVRMVIWSGAIAIEGN